jgi:hypothetical protein
MRPKVSLEDGVLELAEWLEGQIKAMLASCSTCKLLRGAMLQQGSLRPPCF